MAIAVPPTTKSSPTEPEKSTKPKFDAFHPEMPQIPGIKQPNTVPQAPNPLRVPQPSRFSVPPQFQRIGGIAAAVLVVAIAILWWVKSIPRKSVAVADSGTPVIEPPAPEASLPGLAASAQDGSEVAATVEELSKPWASKKFLFENALTRESVKSMVMRLPGGTLWAFSLEVPYGQCELEFVTDLGRLSKQYGYRASHPMVANPCNGTVYDPLKVGPLGGNVWVRGEIVQGGDLRPPISINVQVKGRSIIADRIE